MEVVLCCRVRIVRMWERRLSAVEVDWIVCLLIVVDSEASRHQGTRQ